MFGEAVDWQNLSPRTSDQHLPAVKPGLEKVWGVLLFWNPSNQKVKSCSKNPHQKIHLPLKPLGQILTSPELLFYLMLKQTQVRSLGRDDPLEKEMVSHSSILAWRIPWTEEPGGLQPMGWQGVRHDWMTLHAYMPNCNLECSGHITWSAHCSSQASDTLGYPSSAKHTQNTYRSRLPGEQTPAWRRSPSASVWRVSASPGFRRCAELSPGVFLKELPWLSYINYSSVHWLTVKANYASLSPILYNST